MKRIVADEKKEIFWEEQYVGLKNMFKEYLDSYLSVFNEINDRTDVVIDKIRNSDIDEEKYLEILQLLSSLFMSVYNLGKNVELDRKEID